jgi:hypothetical protein
MCVTSCSCTYPRFLWTVTGSAMFDASVIFPLCAPFWCEGDEPFKYWILVIYVSVILIVTRME